MLSNLVHSEIHRDKTDFYGTLGQMSVQQPEANCPRCPVQEGLRLSVYLPHLLPVCCSLG